MTGNPKLDKVILGLNGLGVLLAVGLVYYSHNMIKKPDTDTAKEYGKMILARTITQPKER